MGQREERPESIKLLLVTGGHWGTIMEKKLQTMKHQKHSDSEEEKPKDATAKENAKEKPKGKEKEKPAREKFFQKEEKPKEKPKSTVVNYVLYELNYN